MAKDNEVQSLRDFGNRKKRYKRRRAGIFIALLIMVGIAGAVYVYRLYNRTYQNYKIMDKSDNTEENIAGYLEYDGAVVRYSKDGAIAVSKSGKQLWNGSYEMKEPIADTCGKYVVVADKGDKSVHIFNEKGEAGSFKTQYNIKKAEIASQGVTAILMEDGATNYIRLYDVEGNLLTENITTNLNNDGYPLDFSLSDDGKKLAVTYLSYNKGELISSVAFYNFDQVGQNLTDNIAGAYIFDQEDKKFIPRIAFLSNDVVCAYKDNGFILYYMPDLSEQVHEETVDGKIKSVLHSSKYTGLVLEGEDSQGSRLLLYNLEGKKLLDKKLTFKYNKIFISGDNIIMYDNNSCQILKPDGKVKFKYTFDSNISALYPADNFDRYILVTAKEIDEIKLLE